MLRIANIIDQETGLEDEGKSVDRDIYQSDLVILGMNDKDFDDMKTYSSSIRDKTQTLLSAIN